MPSYRAARRRDPKIRTDVGSIGDERAKPGGSAKGGEHRAHFRALVRSASTLCLHSPLAVTSTTAEPPDHR
jgi:hypothetical protein